MPVGASHPNVVIYFVYEHSLNYSWNTTLQCPLYSVPEKRLFFLGKDVFCPKWARLSHKHFERLVFMKGISDTVMQFRNMFHLYFLLQYAYLIFSLKGSTLFNDYANFHANNRFFFANEVSSVMCEMSSKITGSTRNPPSITGE